MLSIPIRADGCPTGAAPFSETLYDPVTGSVYVSVALPAQDALVRVDLASNQLQTIGITAFRSIWGLTLKQGHLVAYTGEGIIAELSTSDASTLASWSYSPQWTGAALSRP
jgi:hypothetical protein